MFGSLLDLLAPARCPGCNRRGALPWCRACAPTPLVAARSCPRCAAPVTRPVPTDGGAGCPLRDSDVAATAAAHDYRGVVATVVRGAKLSGWSSAYPGLAEELAAAVDARGWPPPDVVTGVPVPAPRRRRRGFDHAGLLARGVAAAADLVFDSLLVVERGAVDRGSSGRVTTGVGAMTARGPVPDDVLLVDDVVTTGATVRAAAAGLVAGGANRVRVATVARAGGHGSPRDGSVTFRRSSG